HAVVVGEARDLVQPRRPQCGGDGAPTGHEDRTRRQHHHMVPGRRGERIPEWLHPFSPPAWYTPTLWEPEKSLANQFCRDSCPSMIRAGFFDPESRKDLTELARDGSAAHRLTRRANALVLLDDGMSCGDVAKVLLLDDDTV